MKTVKTPKAITFSRYLKFALVFIMPSIFSLTAYANDALTTINNLSDLVFAVIRAIGIIMLGWGMVQIGMSLQSHDPSQRTNGFLFFFGGLLITFAKEILTAIGVS